jgi:membrane protease YdiL (CAAX protease family)
MGALAWIVAPAIAARGGNLTPVLMVCLAAGLIWQFVLVLLLNGFSLRKLWLQRPSTSDGHRGGRLWLWVLPFALGFGALQLVPLDLPTVASHDFGAFLAAENGRDLLRGNWGLYALILVMMIFNTVLGEELLFRGLLMAYPTKRWRSAWMGIIVHSTQSVVLAAVTLALVLA